jgi:hypothetical protein
MSFKRLIGIIIASSIMVMALIGKLKTADKPKSATTIKNYLIVSTVLPQLNIIEP